MPLATRPDRGRFKDAPALIPGAPAWPGGITGGLNFLSLRFRLTSRELDMLIVGGVLGEAAAGLFKVAKQLSSILAKLTDPLYAAVYPELAKLWANARYVDFERIILRSGALCGGGGLLVFLGFALFGEEIIAWTVGAEFLGAYPVLLFYMLAIAIAVLGVALQTAKAAVR